MWVGGWFVGAVASRGLSDGVRIVVLCDHGWFVHVLVSVFCRCIFVAVFLCM